MPVLTLSDVSAKAASPYEADIAAASGVLHVDLDALAHNYGLICKAAPCAKAAAVVKADAYGLGVAPVSRRLWAEGCRQFFVAEASEGRVLRALLPDATIYVLDGLFPDAAPLFSEYRLQPCLSTLDEVAEWARECHRVGKRLEACLHFDTGLTRLGLTAGEAEMLIGQPQRLDAMAITLVMSHLACGDDAANPQNEAQRLRFDALRARLPFGLDKAPASLANTAGTFLGNTYQYDLLRPGIGLYGGNPFINKANPFRPVVTAQARILQLREADEGTGVGYGADYRIKGHQRLAVLSIGYADGYFRVLSNRDRDHMRGGSVYVAGMIAPVVGRVSMDMLTIDVTHIPKDTIKRGDLAELIGPHIDLDDVGARAGTIGYEILTSLGKRYMRLYQANGTITDGERA
ncbi:MAG: alanine racemase [Rhizobiales bacterium]|nr:alanine racemase [Hyphomicrobiales bacterium]